MGKNGPDHEPSGTGHNPSGNCCGVLPVGRGGSVGAARGKERSGPLAHSR
jgi:hypothetical protein